MQPGTAQLGRRFFGAPHYLGLCSVLVLLRKTYVSFIAGIRRGKWAKSADPNRRRRLGGCADGQSSWTTRRRRHCCQNLHPDESRDPQRNRPQPQPARRMPVRPHNLMAMGRLCRARPGPSGHLRPAVRTSAARSRIALLPQGSGKIAKSCRPCLGRFPESRVRLR